MDKFWARVEPMMDDRGCWEWTGARISAGYGVMRHNGANIYAHRLSVIISGRDVEGLFVCHTCDNPSCVNPSHLFVGSARDNMADKKAKNRSNNPIGSRNSHTKLSAQQVLTIKTGDKSNRYYADMFNVNIRCVYDIRVGKNWKHVSA